MMTSLSLMLVPCAMHIEVASEVVDRILAEAAKAHPQEACGLLLGQRLTITNVVPADNVHPAPQTRFEIDPQALIDAHRNAREGGLQVLGYYHSHPDGAAEPSDTDCAMASGDGRIWAIVAARGVRFWQDNPDGFAPLSYELVDV